MKEALIEFEKNPTFVSNPTQRKILSCRHLVKAWKLREHKVLLVPLSSNLESHMCTTGPHVTSDRFHWWLHTAVINVSALVAGRTVQLVHMMN